MRRLAQATILLSLIAATTAGASSAPKLRCPIKPGMPTAGDVQWSFGDQTPAAYVHGHGTWTSGRASGQMCITRSSSTVVLAVSGASRLQTATAGADVVLTVPVKVSASSEAACPVSTRGSVTLYAHYHVTGVDTARFRFAAACSAETHSYGGSTLHMLITRHGSHV